MLVYVRGHHIWEKLMKNNTLIEKARVGLDVKFQSDDLGEITFREYLRTVDLT